MKKKYSLILFLLLPFLAIAQTWNNVGTAGFSAGGANHQSLAFDSANTPYVAYSDGGNSGKTTVMKFNGTAWELVGTAGFSAGSTFYQSLAFDSANTPYIAYQDSGNSGKTTVMKFNGTAWVAVGTAGFSTGRAQYQSLAFDSTNTPYVAYQDNGNSYKTTVMKFNGTAWVAVGTAGFSIGSAEYQSLAFDSANTPYVAYSDGGNSVKTTVMKFNGTAWIVVGTVGFSIGSAQYQSLVLDSTNTPYVAYQDYGNSGKTTVMKFNGTAWELVGTAGFSIGSAQYQSLALDSTNTPYVAYSDSGNSYKTTVMKFNGTAWVAVGTAGFSAGNAFYQSLAFNNANIPYVAYRDIGNSLKTTVMNFGTLPVVSSNTTTSITSSGAALNGNVSSAGGATITERGFVYALSSDDSTPTVAEANGSTVVKVVVSGTTGAFNKAITGLTANKTYSFIAYAINSVGTTESSVATFTTVNTPPTFTSTAITSVDQGDTYTYSITTNDVDADNVTLTAPTKPSWLSLTRTIIGGNVTTVAGTVSSGSTDGNGTSASFRTPHGVAVDGSGNVYVADTHNHIIRKVAPNGDVTTFAGTTGSPGDTDANGTSASFDNPYGVALDGSGNLYVADGENNKIRKIAPNGDVTTLAGSGSYGSMDGNGTSASFKTPYGVAVDGSGNVYVADANNRKIRKIAPNGDVTTLAGSGNAGSMDGNGTSASFVLPFGITVDGLGNAYVADGFGNTIRKIAPNGDVTTIAGSVSFSNPFGIVVDDSGNVYVSETTSNKIRKITPNGDVTTIAGSGSQGSMDGDGTSASFYSPAGIALDATGNFYVADRFNNKIRKIITTASSTLTGDSTGQTGDHAVVLEANDGYGGTVQQSFSISVNTKPTVSSSAATAITATKATLNGNVSSDGGATITERGFVYALSSDDSTPTVAEVNGTTVVKVIVSGTTGAFNETITGLTVNGTYSFVAYAINSVGTTESSVATFTTVNTPPTFTSTAITSVDQGDTYTYTITTNDVDGDNITLTAPTKPSWLSLTTNLGDEVTTFAGSGNTGNMNGNGSAASFNKPFGVAVDGSGNVYVAETDNHSIRKITPNGDVTTFAGTGNQGNMDGNGTSASFYDPIGLAIDGSGNVYVADASP
jgi:hypothetical protein